MHDFRAGWRLLRQAPGFTAIAVLVFALGIGANTALFSVADAVLVAPLPYAHPGQLVQLYTREITPGHFPISGPDFVDWKMQANSFADLSLFRGPFDVSVTGHGDPRRVRGVDVEDNFFRLLGVKPVLGSAYPPGSSQPLAVLSYGFWQSEFGGDPAVVGKSLELNGAPRVVAGVLPASFRWQPDYQIWLPLDITSQALGQRGFYSFSAIGRLHPNATVEQAQVDLNGVAARVAQQYPATNRGIGVTVSNLRDSLVGAPERTSLLTLLAVAGLVLLIACANVANMLLARGLRRRKEIAVRLALGASRYRIVRQLLAESVELAVLGGALGALAAWAAVRAAAALPALQNAPRPVTLNAAVLAATLAIAVVCGIAFGLAPGVQLARMRLQPALGQAGTGAAATRNRLTRALVACEVALALVLVVLAGLFLQSFARQRSRPLGFEAGHVLTMSVSSGDVGSLARVQDFQREFIQRVQALPGVEAAAFASELPLEGGQNNGYPVIAGQSTIAKVLVEDTRVSPSYFAAMHLPVLAGTLYDAAQQQAWMNAAPSLWAPGGAPNLPVNLGVVVNQAFAGTFFANQNPIGQRFRDDPYSPWITIQGVVANIPILGPRQTEAMPQVFFPVFSGPNLILRSQLDPAALTASVRHVLARMGVLEPVYNVREMNQVVGEASGDAALQSGLIGAFAALALLLAAAGVFGVMAYMTAGRTREIGIRMALGASRGAVVGWLLREYMAMAGAGVAIGIVAALATARIVQSQLFEAPPRDLRILVGAATVVVIAGLGAAYWPAHRAAKTDPMQVLRAS